MDPKAQNIIVKKGFKYNNLFDLGFSVGNKEYASALGWNHLHGIGKNENFKIGYGIRWSGYLGAGDKNYMTAPAKLTSGQEGPQVLFTGYINDNIDTVKISDPIVGMINAYITLQYTFFKRLDLGINIDLIGFSFGNRVSVNSHPNYSYTSQYYTALYSQSPSYQGREDASPTNFNLLLVSDNDIGGLNSEFFIRYWFNDQWAIKGMFTFIFTEYTTANKLRLGNDRFRNKSILFGLGVTYCPWKN